MSDDRLWVITDAEPVGFYQSPEQVIILAGNKIIVEEADCLRDRLAVRNISGCGNRRRLHQQAHLADESPVVDVLCQRMCRMEGYDFAYKTPSFGILYSRQQLAKP